uniref:Uncharacterized protein n=1 Tax=Oryza nivara TaxID=4536 RepID=A0A0E0IIF4_ORYNI
MKRELDHLANFLQAAVDYKKNGFRAYNRNLPFYSSSYGTVMGGLLSDKFLDTNTSV